jgi:hypothetical protein
MQTEVVAARQVLSHHYKRKSPNPNPQALILNIFLAIVLSDMKLVADFEVQDLH